MHSAALSGYEHDTMQGKTEDSCFGLMMADPFFTDTAVGFPPIHRRLLLYDDMKTIQ